MKNNDDAVQLEDALFSSNASDPGFIDDEDIDAMDPTIFLTDEKGHEEAFEFLDIISYESKEYVVLAPLDEDENEACQVVILQYDGSADDGVTDTYSSIGDDHVLEQVFAIFRERNSEKYDFIDD